VFETAACRVKLRTTRRRRVDGGLEDLAAEAFAYGYPLIEQTRALAAVAEGKGPFAAPVKTFRHVRLVLNAKLARELGIVSPNNNTLYSIAAVDVGPEPLVLRVPRRCPSSAPRPACSRSAAGSWSTAKPTSRT
jgi:hypothetical protein